jgi:hypothetical protein
MPLYDFKCTDPLCKAVTEHSFGMLEVPPTVRCPAHLFQNPMVCNSLANRVFTPPILNLNHWVPDYRNCDDGQKEAIAAGIYE